MIPVGPIKVKEATDYTNLSRPTVEIGLQRRTLFPSLPARTSYARTCEPTLCPGHSLPPPPLSLLDADCRRDGVVSAYCPPSSFLIPVPYVSWEWQVS